MRKTAYARKKEMEEAMKQPPSAGLLNLIAKMAKACLTHDDLARAQVSLSSFVYNIFGGFV